MIMVSPSRRVEELKDNELESDLDEELRERYQHIKDEEKTADTVEQLKKLRESADFWDDEFTE